MSDSGRKFLGVDGGGTSTVAWIGQVGGQVLGRARAGPSNAKAVGVALARQALGDAISGAFADAGIAAETVASACFGLAGFDRPDDKRLLAEWVSEAGWAREVLFVNDGDLVVAAGTPEGWGIGVIAGTGSIAVGRSPEGLTARAGGWGHLMGDEGSAYSVALGALRIVARRADGRNPRPVPDPLTETLCKALGVDTPARIVSALYDVSMDRTRIAALAPSVLEVAGLDQQIGRGLLPDAGTALGEQVAAVARALAFPHGPIPLALAGSFLLAASEVVEALLKRIEQAGYSAVPTHVPEPVKGALILAEKGFPTRANWAAADRIGSEPPPLPR